MCRLKVKECRLEGALISACMLKQLGFRICSSPTDCFRGTSSLEDAARQMTSQGECILQEEVEGLLKSSGQLRTLAMLYENKELVLPALQVWQSLALRQVPGQRTVGKSADTVSAQGNVETEAATEAARLLEVSNDSDIVLDHISWASCQMGL